MHWKPEPAQNLIQSNPNTEKQNFTSEDKAQAVDSNPAESEPVQTNAPAEQNQTEVAKGISNTGSH